MSYDDDDARERERKAAKAYLDRYKAGLASVWAHHPAADALLAGLYHEEPKHPVGCYCDPCRRGFR